MTPPQSTEDVPCDPEAIREQFWTVSKERDELVAETGKLRAKISRQRKELRRINKMVEILWRGWTYHHHIETQLRYRAKMAKAFGLDAVCAAEKAL